MKRVVFITGLLVLIIAQYAIALDTPDFSGTWVLDSVIDMNAPAGVSSLPKPKTTVTVVIKQTKTTFSVDRKAGERIETTVLKLDGTESISKLPSGKERKSTSSWVGSTLVIKSITDMGKTKVPSTEIFSLSPDGKVMTVEMTTQSPRGETKRKVTYIKQ